jgi:hypothetical protein
MMEAGKEQHHYKNILGRCIVCNPMNHIVEKLLASPAFKNTKIVK